MSTIDVAVVGSRFGAAFLPLYRRHPQVDRVALVDLDHQALDKAAETFGVDDRFTSLDALLATDTYDAVHVASPVRFHVDQSVAVLRSGRHCASAVPMATTLDGVEQVLEAEQMGPLTLLRDDHIQNLDGFPHYWQGYPPLTYATRPTQYDPGEGRAVVWTGAAHGGSHPHLAHEFVWRRADWAAG